MFTALDRHLVGTWAPLPKTAAHKPSTTKEYGATKVTS